MTLAHPKFKYQDQFIIEKMKIRAPYQYEAMFQNTGCFIYFKGDRPTILTSEMNMTLKSNEAILLKCGTHFIDILKKTDNEEVEVIAVHLFPEILKKLYVGKLPAIIEQQTKNRSSQVGTQKPIHMRSSCAGIAPGSTEMRVNDRTTAPT